MKWLSVKRVCSLLLATVMASGAMAVGSALAEDGRYDPENSKIEKTKAKYAGWYIRLTAQSDGLEDNNTVLGYLKGASDGKDKFDSEALSTSGRTYLYTTIYHADFGATNNYRSDYRAYKKLGRASDSWTIKVNSGDEYAVVTLSWDGITVVRRDGDGNFKERHVRGKRALKKMRLVDVQTGEVIEAFAGRTSSTYSFNMDGQHEREFIWMLLKNGEEEPYFDPNPTPMRASLMTTKSRSYHNDDTAGNGFGPPSFVKR